MEAELQLVSTLATQGIFTTDTELRIRSWNLWLEQTTGRTSAQMQGVKLFEAYPELSRHAHKCYQAALNGEARLLAHKFHHYLLPIPTRLGNFDYMRQSVRIAPLLEQERIIGTVTVIEDVTDRVMREAELHHQLVALQQHTGRLEELRQIAEASERRFQFLSEVSALLAASLEYRTTLKDVARLSVPILGDLCFFDVLSDDRLERLAWHHKDADKQLFFDEIRNYAPPTDFTVHPVSGMFVKARTVLIDEVTEGWLRAITFNAQHYQFIRALNFHSLLSVPLVARERCVGALTFCLVSPPRRYTSTDLSLAEDLANRIALAVDNARLYQDAERANRLKDEFLATVSHELRTPLTAILGWARLLRTGKLDLETSTRALDTIERNARAQSQLVEDLLDVSRIITGKLRLEKSQVDLAAVVEATINSVRPAAEAKNITLHMTLEPGYTFVMGDAMRLQQIVWNLLSNAVKFTPEYGRVEISLKRVGTFLEVVVCDTGQGISAQFLPYVFERFRQADSSLSRLQGGLGLGLAIVRHLVELHGGQVRVESAGAGQGATFTVRLPARDESAAPSTPKLTESLIEHSPSLQGVKVLVVEDEADARDMLSVLLIHCQADVVVCSNAQEALEQLPLYRPDVLVSDIGLPGMDGHELIRKVRALGPEAGGRVPAVALTAFATSEDRLRALSAGFNMHLPKPVDPLELIMVIDSLLAWLKT